MGELPLPRLPGVAHRFADVGGVRIHYAEAGSGPPVVLQHGWPQHWWAWRELVAPLAENHRVICPDLRGFGWSEAPPSGYDKPQLAEDLLGLLDALGLERVTLVGHDWGAMVGYIACVRRPERFERYLALAFPPPWPPEGPPSLKRLALVLGYQGPMAAPGVGPLVVARTPYARELLRRGRALGRFSDEEIETYSRALRRPESARATSRLYRSFLTSDLPAIARGELPGGRLTVPSRALLGGADPLTRDVDADYGRRAGSLEIEFIAGCGHFVPEERPDVVLARLAAG